MKRYKCPNCGAVMDFVVAPWDLECPDCDSIAVYFTDGSVELRSREDYEDIYEERDDMPECCVACGGPYPNCTTSCKIFDN